MSAPAADAALPGLAAALDTEIMTTRLTLLLETGGRPGPWRVVRAEVLKHTRGRRCAVRYLLDGPGGAERLFGKVFAGGRGRSACRRLELLAAAVPPADLILPRPIGHLPDLDLVITEFLEGEPLARALYDGDSDAPARRMGEALAVLHGAAVRLPRRWSAAEEIRVAGDRAAALDRVRGAPAGHARALLGRLASWSRDLPAAPEVPLHRDFYAEQVWDCGGRTALLDLDDARSGDPAVDLGNFLAHLELRSLQFPSSARACARARAAFLDGYGRRGRPVMDREDRDRRTRFYEAASLLRLAGVYADRPRWALVLPRGLVAAGARLLEREVA